MLINCISANVHIITSARLNCPLSAAMQACNLLRHSTEDKISYIFYIFLSRVVLELRRENEIAENKNWLL